MHYHQQTQDLDLPLQHHNIEDSHINESSHLLPPPPPPTTRTLGFSPAGRGTTPGPQNYRRTIVPLSHTPLSHIPPLTLTVPSVFVQGPIQQRSTRTLSSSDRGGGAFQK